MARGLVGSRRRYPSRWSTARWAWTVDDEVRPTDSPISRTDGGYPRSLTASEMQSRICLRLVLSTWAMSPLGRLTSHQPADVCFHEPTARWTQKQTPVRKNA